MKRFLTACALLGASILAYPATPLFYLSSPDIKGDGKIPRRFEFNGFGCSGDNQSPALKWSGAPKGTRSFAVTVYDPDAPTGSGWVHWMVFNIASGATELPGNAGALSSASLRPGAIQARNDFGLQAWGGVCPPRGDRPHRYIFTVHALKVDRLDVPPDATAAFTGYMIHANSLGKASFTARYGRKK